MRWIMVNSQVCRGATINAEQWCEVHGKVWYRYGHAVELQDLQHPFGILTAALPVCHILYTRKNWADTVPTGQFNNTVYRIHIHKLSGHDSVFPMHLVQCAQLPEAE